MLPESNMRASHQSCLQDGNSVLVDPSLEEEAAAAGTLTAVLNSHSEVCAIHKSGGIGLSLPQVELSAFGDAHSGLVLHIWALAIQWRSGHRKIGKAVLCRSCGW